MSPLFCGSHYRNKDGEEVIGYTPTKQYDLNSGPLTLGQAITVSGAAASPNMGHRTSPVTAFMMTLFNIRLGSWFPNPKIPLINKRFGLVKTNLHCFLMELLGIANERSSFLSLSDGGHFENMTAYELVKRKCKVTIISDGEEDPKYHFEGLGKLIRLCEVDFGAKILIDVSSLQPEKESSWSRNRFAIGEIIYDDDSKGTLIYIKASMNGQEGTAIQQYKAAHPDFPHEATKNQFYSEDQFESYRSLGFDITKQIFDPVMLDVDQKTELYNPENLENDDFISRHAFINRAKKLQEIWSPLLLNNAQFSRHTDRLMKIWSEISKNKDLKSLGQQLWPQPPDVLSSEFYLCSELFQLMENVYLDLDLEETWEHADNEGWRTLFIQWASSNTFKQTWEKTNKNYGSRFRYFCERRLSLTLPDDPSPQI